MTRKRRGLGRGLDAILPSTPEDTGTAEQQLVRYVDVERLEPNPHQPRQSIDEDELQSLAQSIREHGLLQPILVTPHPEKSGRYIIIAGERRWRAARLCGLREIPVIVHAIDERRLLEWALIENVQRADLNPLEVAEAYHRLQREFGLSQQDIAERVGKSRVAVANTLRLLRLAPKVKEALRQNLITEGHARALLSLPTHEAQEAALKTILDKGLSVRDTEALVRQISGQRPKLSSSPKPDPDIQLLEQRLEAFLNTKVRLRRNRKGRGTLTLYFYSDEELEALLRRLLKG